MFFKNEDTAEIGGKKVDVRKLTVAKWKKVFGSLNQLPGVIISVFTQGRKTNITPLIVAAVDICFDEVLEIIAIASDLDKAYLEEHAALDEIVDYIEKLVKKNNLAETIKKLATAGRPLFKPLLEKAEPEA